ncbi:MAG: alpha/beta fold hydrolase [Lachnospiraceae bacterium]|nr:alpha/beta fold hydrolase [Lachnospiraceae bacterium]
MKNRKTLKVILMILAALTVVAAVVTTILMGAIVTENILHMNKSKDTHDNSMRQLELYGYDADAFLEKYHGEEIKVTTTDGNEVPATYFDNDSEKLVILVHGAGGDRYHTYPLAEQYLMRGYDVIAHDQRGSGVNPDRNVTFGIKESLDVRALVVYARETLGKENVFVHGLSMGGQTTAIYASNVTPGEKDAADLVICDSPVPGMEYMVRSSIGGDTEEEMHTPLVNYLMSSGKLYMKVTTGIDMKVGDTISQVEKDQLPTMIIVSERDTVCLPEKVEEVYEHVGSADKKIVYVDSKHVEGVIDDPEGYMEYVTEFLNSHDL